MYYIVGPDDPAHKILGSDELAHWVVRASSLLCRVASMSLDLQHSALDHVLINSNDVVRGPHHQNILSLKLPKDTNKPIVKDKKRRWPEQQL